MASTRRIASETTDIHDQGGNSRAGIPESDKFWEMFAVVIQLGAILALSGYFRKRILTFVRTFPKGQNGDRTWINHPLSLVMIAFVVTAIPALLLKKLIEHNLESLTVMGWALIIGGIVMGVVDLTFRKPRITHMEQMGILEAVWIGAVQILSALFPGTSRSMCTIAAGQVFSMSRAAALEFSFFLSMPTMCAATLKELKDYLHPSADPVTHIRPPAIHLTGDQWTTLFIGTIVSFFVAWVVIAWFMQWVRKHGFIPFAIYRLLIGGFVLYLAFKA